MAKPSRQKQAKRKTQARTKYGKRLPQPLTFGGPTATPRRQTTHPCPREPEYLDRVAPPAGRSYTRKPKGCQILYGSILSEDSPEKLATVGIEELCHEYSFECTHGELYSSCTVATAIPFKFVLKGSSMVLPHL